jgi:hypothetical protein
MNYRSDATLGLGTIDSLSTFSGSSSSLLQQLPIHHENEKESGAASSSVAHAPFTRLSMGSDMLDQTLRFSGIPTQQTTTDSAACQSSSNSQTSVPPNTNNSTPSMGNGVPNNTPIAATSDFISRIPSSAPPPPHHPPSRRQEITPAEYSHLWRDEPDWKLLDIFFTHVYPSVALIPRQAFYQIASEEPALLLNAMYALAAGFQQNENGEVDRNAGLAYFTEAKNHLVAEIETPSFAIVYAMYLLSYYAMRMFYIPLYFADV